MSPGSTPGTDSSKVLQIWRQSGANDAGKWERFAIRAQPNDTLADALRSIASNPVTDTGDQSSAVQFEAPQMDGTHGECCVLVGGEPRLPSRTRLADLGPLVVLSPMGKFPIIRDLAVDLRAAKATVDRLVATAGGEEPDLALFADCIGCGACLEACPQFGAHSEFVGAAALAAVNRLDHVPTGRDERMNAMLATGGVEACGNAQTCVDVCPAGIPLATAIGRVKRASVRYWLRSLLTN